LRRALSRGDDVLIVVKGEGEDLVHRGGKGATVAWTPKRGVGLELACSTVGYVRS
jgi:hypothetical protein